MPTNMSPRLMLRAVSSLLVSKSAKYASATRKMVRPEIVVFLNVKFKARGVGVPHLYHS